MKTYEGIRTDEGCQVTVDGRPLEPRYDLRNHSPAGFEYGYQGSGPAQLSLALLADCLEDDDLAQNLYQEFKRKVIAILEGNRWRLTEAEVRAKVAKLLAEGGRHSEERP